VTSLQFVRELVARGADVNARLKSGGSGKGELSHKGATPFMMAAETADVPLMQTLVELGADPQLPNDFHSTPLMAAAGLGVLAPGEEAGTEEEAIEAVRLTLKLGNDINAVDDNGETAMHGAAYKIAPGMVRFLAENGARVEIWNRTNKWGWTPITIAEGYRPGNFRPSAETLAALHAAMRAAGVTPPAPTPRPPIKSASAQAGN
jgi:ankyrin repeat protein